MSLRFFAILIHQKIIVPPLTKRPSFFPYPPILCHKEGMATLKLQLEGQFIKETPLSKDLTTIGRSDTCDLPVDNPGVSRIHCQIKYIKKTNTYLIHDNGSSNGTFVNGEQIPGFQELKNGDLINLGKYAVLFDQHEIETERPKQPEQSITITKDHVPLEPIPTGEIDNPTGTATAYDPNFVMSQDEVLVKQAVQWISIGAGATLLIAVAIYLL